jgi:CheY-like chemotaxis protein
MRVLYVEDNRINALLFEQIVQLRGELELRVAEDGSSAIDLARQWQPEVLVLDANLPDMDGFGLLSALRAVPGLEATPAFMCSADARPEDLRRASAAGFGGYWPKPITVARVLADLDALAAARGAA